jgi:signal transduction histidine kinase
VIRLHSLRGRLVAAMSLVFALGLAGALMLPPLEQGVILLVLGRYGPLLLHDPYQDVLLLIPIIFASLALIWFVSGWSLRPLARASSEAAKAGPRTPAARIGSRGLPSEVRPLVDAVNGALDRLANAYAGERRFTADAAHELRTPLAVLNLRLQRAKVEDATDWAAIDRELAQMNRLVEQLLDLARKEHAGHEVPVPDLPVVNLSRIAREAAAATVPLAEAAGRTLEVELPDTLLVRGRANDLRDALRNLLDNALTHGQGTIRLLGCLDATGRDRTQVVVEVADEGPGVAAELRDVVFDRFRKGRQDSPGSGLGLAIVREVVQSHNGSVELMPGPGCQARIALPTAPDPSGPASRARKAKEQVRPPAGHTAAT